MEITPPISPREDDVSTPDIPLLKTGDHGFECISDVARGSQFHPEGLLLSGEALLFTNYRSICSRRNSCFDVFEQLYDVDSVNQEDLKMLFNIAKSRLCMLDAAQKLNIGTYGILTGSGSSNSQIDYAKLRKELREFFIMLRFFIAVECSKEESIWIVEHMLSCIVSGLSLIRAQLGWLTDLPTYVLNHAQMTGGGTKSTAQVAFHLLHCHLELRWLHITSLWQLSSGAPSSMVLNSTQMSQGAFLQTSQSSNGDQHLKTHLFRAVQLCVIDLLKMSVLRFNKLSHEEMVYKSAFNCMCVKELWVLLRFVIEQLEEHDEKMTFWGLIDSLLQLIVRGEEKHDAKKISRLHLVTNESIVCTDPNLFTLWLLRHLAEIFMYDRYGYQLDSSYTMHSSNHSALNRVLKSLMDPSVSLTEWQRRVLVTLVRVLITDLWEAKPELIMTLWDGFYRCLDSAFQLPGAGAGSYAVMSETAQGMLDSVINLLDSKPSKNKNSYELFLHLLGQYLHRNPLHWKQKMRGRVYSKLSPRKVESLSEMGLFHLVQLFLTVAIRTDIEDVATSLQNLLQFNETSALKNSKNSMVMRAHLSMVLLYARRGLPLGPLLKPLTLVVCNHLTCAELTVPRMFVETLEDIMLSSQSLQLDQHLLVGEWVQQYLTHPSCDASRIVLNAMLSVMKKVRSYAALDYGSAGGGAEKLVSSLREHLLPYVKEQMSSNFSSPFQVADLAAQFTLLSLEFSPTQVGRGQCSDSFTHLLHLFVMSDFSNIAMVRRYVWLMLSDEMVLNLSGQTSEQLILIQAWMRCSIQCSDPDNQEMCKITHSVFKLSLMKSLLHSSNDTLKSLQGASDPLCSVLKHMGDTFQSQYRKEYIQFLQPIERWIRELKKQLFPPKSKDTNQKLEHSLPEIPKEVVSRVFYVLGKLTLHCGKIIFEKNTSSCLLVQIVSALLLPATVYKIDVRLPIAMDEALRQSLLLFLRGLHKLDPAKDQCIKRYMWDLVVVYVPRMAVHPGMLGCVGQTNPFVKIWDEPEFVCAATATVQVVCSTLLQLEHKKTTQPHQHYVQGLRLIRDLIKRHDNDYKLMSVMIEHPLPNMLEVVAKVTDLSANMKLKETEVTIRHIFQSHAYCTHPPLWEQTNNVLTQLSKKYLSLNIDIFSRVLNFLVKDFRPIVKRFLPELKVHFEDAIRKRGTGNDRPLKLMWEKLETAVNS